MSEDTIISMVGSLGFPIVVALYVLIRLETTIKENTKLLQALYTKITGDVAGETK